MPSKKPLITRNSSQWSRITGSMRRQRFRLITPSGQRLSSSKFQSGRGRGLIKVKPRRNITRGGPNLTTSYCRFNFRLLTFIWRRRPLAFLLPVLVVSPSWFSSTLISLIIPLPSIKPFPFVRRFSPRAVTLLMVFVSSGPSFLLSYFCSRT